MTKRKNPGERTDAMADSTEEKVDLQAMRQAKLGLGLMDFEDLVRRCRSYRRFDEEAEPGRGPLLAFVDLARKASSAMNKQPLRYGIVDEPADRERLFGGLRFAAALPEWQGPEPGERPTGYVVVYSDGEPGNLTWADCGIACQTMALAATSCGMGACMVRSFDPQVVEEVLPHVDEALVPMLVVAFGVPSETVVLETLEHPSDSTTYWRDEDSVHHVPKRSLDSIIVG